MLSNNPKYQNYVHTYLFDIYNKDLLPKDHVNFLEKINNE